ncbi:MAG: hypothetical protein IKE14_13955 [Loktanella sp.]|nr:hypothetical protein [Loktanella sp.]
MILRYLIAIAVCAMATTATAQDRGAVSAGLGVTSFGYALEGAYQLRPTLGLRGMIMGGFSIDDTFDYEDTAVDGTADLGGTAVVADYYPLANAWRMSGGLFFSNSDVSGSFTEGAVTYDGKLAFENDVAPMVTTGVRIGFGAGWGLSGDIGVIMSSLQVSSSNTNPTVQTAVNDTNADLSDVPVFPFAGFTVSYAY